MLSVLIAECFQTWRLVEVLCSGFLAGVISDRYRHEKSPFAQQSATHQTLAQKASKINSNAEPCGICFEGPL